jgi:hypothetical protein
MDDRAAVLERAGTKECLLKELPWLETRPHCDPPSLCPLSRSLACVAFNLAGACAECLVHIERVFAGNGLGGAVQSCRGALRRMHRDNAAILDALSKHCGKCVPEPIEDLLPPVGVAFRHDVLSGPNEFAAEHGDSLTAQADAIPVHLDVHHSAAT